MSGPLAKGCHGNPIAYGSELATMMPVADAVPNAISWFAVPAAGTVPAVQLSNAPTVEGTVASDAEAESVVQAPNVVYAVVVNVWNPAVNFITGAIRIGTGNT